MTYRLKFKAEADKEWRRLDANTQRQFVKKLAERLENPRIPAAKLRDAKDRYKIKLRTSGYRLVYEVRDAEIVVLVIAIGKRDKDQIYLAAARR
jgi:mRNA interferase RelE/StbE